MDLPEPEVDESVNAFYRQAKPIRTRLTDQGDRLIGFDFEREVLEDIDHLAGRVSFASV